MPAITLRVFQFVMYSLLIYCFSLDKFTKIAAEDPYALNVNKVGRSERNVLILDESALHSSREHVERDWERRSRNRRAEPYFTIDDEDDFVDDEGEASSFNLRNVRQVDAPVSSPTDQNVDVKKNEVNSSSTNTALQVGTATSAKSNTIANSTASRTNSNENGTVVSSTRKPVVISATATPPLRISPSTISAQNTIDIKASSSTLSETSYLLTETVIPTRDISAQTSMSVFSAYLANPTVHSTTKGENDALGQQDPKEKKTLFAFVTIEILVALLAGAACTVILLVFLVHRLKKRHEGSYELQETLMIKSGATAEEKEVFV